MFALLMLACSTYDVFEVRAGCTSVTTDAQGVVTTQDYTSFGWPSLQSVDRDGEVTETVIEYQLVAGSVREKVGTTGDIVVRDLYDAFGNLTMSETNLFGVEDVICDNTYDGETIETSSCNGVDTTYDACGNPLEVLSSTFAEAFTNSYLRCQPQNSEVDGVDRAGAYSRTIQFDAEGRPNGTTTARDNRTSSSLTTWDCPQ